MSKNNFIGTEIKSSRDVVLDAETYNLSHLDSHILEVVDDRKPNNIFIYKFYVAYSFHFL